MPDPALSPAMQVLTLLWQHQSRRVTQRQQAEGMRQGLTLVLTMGLPFALEDFVWLSTNPRPSYYDITPLGFGAWCTQWFRESIYCTAIQGRHTSACLAYEHWRHRAPFFWKGQRLYVGAGLDWEGQLVIVTSFDDLAGTLTACGYAKITVYAGFQDPRVQGEGPPTRRVTLTPAMLRAVPIAARKEEG